MADFISKANPYFLIGLGVAIGFSSSFILKNRFGGIPKSIKRRNSPPPKQKEKASSSSRPSWANEEMKLVLVVNSELKLGKGKMAAQCCHATVACVEELMRTNMEMANFWRYNAQPKVVLKADNVGVLNELKREARSRGLVATIISDAGRTQIARGSKTVLGVGPGPESLVNEVTGHLKLM